MYLQNNQQSYNIENNYYETRVFLITTFLLIFKSFPLWFLIQYVSFIPPCDDTLIMIFQIIRSIMLQYYLYQANLTDQDHVFYKPNLKRCGILQPYCLRLACQLIYVACVDNKTLGMKILCTHVKELFSSLTLLSFLWPNDLEFIVELLYSAVQKIIL